MEKNVDILVISEWTINSTQQMGSAFLHRKLFSEPRTIVILVG